MNGAPATLPGWVLAPAAETLASSPAAQHGECASCPGSGNQCGRQRRRNRREHGDHEAFPNREPKRVVSAELDEAHGNAQSDTDRNRRGPANAAGGHCSAEEHRVDGDNANGGQRVNTHGGQHGLDSATLAGHPPFDRYAVMPVARNVWQHIAHAAGPGQCAPGEPRAPVFGRSGTARRQPARPDAGRRGVGHRRDGAGRREHARRPDDGGEGQDEGDEPTCRHAAHRPFRQVSPTLNEGWGVNPGDTDGVVPFMRGRIGAQRRPGREPRRHFGRRGATVRGGPLNEGRGIAGRPGNSAWPLRVSAAHGPRQRRPGLRTVR